MRKLVFFVILSWSLVSVSLAKESERDVVLLPVYPLSVEIKASSGQHLVKRIEPNLEFKNLSIFIVKDSNSPTGYLIPKDLQAAALELREMLPKEFYVRLVSQYKQLLQFGVIREDPAVCERVEDLAYFLQYIWDSGDQRHILSKEFSKHDRLQVLVNILDLAKKR